MASAGERQPRGALAAQSMIVPGADAGGAACSPEGALGALLRAPHEMRPRAAGAHCILYGGLSPLM